MSKQFINKIFAVTFLFLGIALATNLVINRTAGVYAQTEAPNVRLQLSTPKSGYLQLESIPLTFKLYNPTTEPVKVQGILTFSSDMDLIIEPAGGQKKIIEGRMINTAAIAAAPAILQPGQEIESGAIIDGVSFFENAFPSPGTYQVRVRFSYEKIDRGESSRETVLSNPVTVNIVAPQGVDLEAYNYLKNTLERARRERASTDELIALQKNFVDSFRTSIYAKHQIWKLALNYSNLGEDLKSMRELCKLTNDNAYYSKQVKRMLNLIDFKLHPIDLTPLPENAPVPVRPHPCSRLRN